MRLLKTCLGVALTLGVQSVCYADSTTEVTSTSTTGPATVVDSYMKPTVVQTKATTDSDGNTQTSVAPIVQERHEKVVIPSSTTTETDVTTSSATQVIHESTAKHYKKAVSHHHYVKPVRHYTAHRSSSNKVAQRVTVIKTPTVVEHHQVTIDRSTVIDRKDPALESN